MAVAEEEEAAAGLLHQTTALAVVAAVVAAAPPAAAVTTPVLEDQGEALETAVVAPALLTSMALLGRTEVQTAAAVVAPTLPPTSTIVAGGVETLAAGAAN